MENSPTVEEFSNYDAGIAAYNADTIEIAIFRF